MSNKSCMFWMSALTIRLYAFVHIQIISSAMIYILGSQGEAGLQANRGNFAQVEISHWNEWRATYFLC